MDLQRFRGRRPVEMIGNTELPVITGELLKYGKHPDTPAGIIERASVGEPSGSVTVQYASRRDVSAGVKTAS